MKKNIGKVFLNGLIFENPTFVQLLGMCPTLAVTTSVKNGLGMGLSAAAVLVCSNVIISLLRKIIPDKVRIILARAEAFASKNSALASAADGLGMGLGFTCALCIISAVREFLGAGTIFDIPVYGNTVSPASIIIMAPGGFIVLGILVAAVQHFMNKEEN